MVYYLKQGEKNPRQKPPSMIRVPDPQSPGGTRVYTAEAVLDHISEQSEYVEVPDPPSWNKDTHRVDWINGEWVVSEKP